MEKPVETKDLEAQVVKVAEYLSTLPLHYRKVNEKPWGTYDPGASWDGHRFVVVHDPHGWGWSVDRAFARALTKQIINDTFGNDYLEWFGGENYEKVRDILEDSNPKSDIILLPFNTSEEQ